MPGVGLEVVADLVLAREGPLLRGERQPGQAVVLGGRVELERVPLPAPVVADAGAGVEDHERAAAALQVVAGRQAGLAGADDDGLDVCGVHAGDARSGRGRSASGVRRIRAPAVDGWIHPRRVVRLRCRAARRPSGGPRCRRRRPGARPRPVRRRPGRPRTASGRSPVVGADRRPAGRLRRKATRPPGVNSSRSSRDHVGEPGELRRRRRVVRLLDLGEVGERVAVGVDQHEPDARPRRSRAVTSGSATRPRGPAGVRMVGRKVMLRRCPGSGHRATAHPQARSTRSGVRGSEGVGCGHDETPTETCGVHPRSARRGPDDARVRVVRRELGRGRT